MIKRTLEKVIDEVSRTFRVLLLTGPRQVGKTTLLESCSQGQRDYVSLDSYENRYIANKDPAQFIGDHPAPVIIDEVQYAPDIFSYIKIAVDQAKKRGMYWLTGSQKFLLMRGITESLAGRVAILDMLGLSQAEIEGRADKVQPFLPTKDWLENARQNAGKPKNKMDIYRAIWRGSFPEIVLNESLSRDRFYESYVLTYIQRDVSDLIKVEDEIAFYLFLRAVAARTGQLLNYADLANDAGIDPKTAKAWLSILKASGLVYLLYPYYRNVTKRLVKTPKLYFLDTGLCAFLTKWPSPESLEAGAMSGAILETYMFCEILKSYWHNGLGAYFYYYRDVDQKEIDLLIEEGDMIYPTEFKKTAMPTRTASKNFPGLERLGKKVGHGAVICLTEKDYSISREVDAIPVSYL